MTTILLIRHATGDHIGRRLVGRSPGAPLNDQGRREAAALAERLRGVAIAAVFASPLERTMATAAPIADTRGLRVEEDADLVEVDFGEWTGRTIESLDGDEAWRLWNVARGTARPPGGESMLEIQGRMVGALGRIARAHPDGIVAVVGHGDPIRAALAHYLGAPLDLALRVEVAPASVSVVRLAPWGPTVLGLNHTGDLRLG